MRIVSIPLEELLKEFDSPEPTPQPRDNKAHITRSAETRAWLVSATVHGQLVELEFPDKLFRGRAFAFFAARSWRDVQTWYLPSWGGTPSVNPIRRFECPAQAGAAVEAFWCASGIDVDGDKWMRRYSIDLWGEEIAMHKAAHARDAQQWDIDEYFEAARRKFAWRRPAGAV